MASTLYPQARRESLHFEQVGDEFLVYDERRHRAHCLNPGAALMFRLSDGRTSIAELGRRAATDLGWPADESLVWHALVQLERAHLLERPVAPPAGARLTRRHLVQSLGVAAGSLAFVTSILSPTAAAAQSGPPPSGTGATGPTGTSGPPASSGTGP
jgi:hypothetical protein